eukprot:g40663.t1
MKQVLKQENKHLGNPLKVQEEKLKDIQAAYKVACREGFSRREHGACLEQIRQLCQALSQTRGMVCLVSPGAAQMGRKGQGGEIGADGRELGTLGDLGHWGEGILPKMDRVLVLVALIRASTVRRANTEESLIFGCSVEGESSRRQHQRQDVEGVTPYFHREMWLWWLGSNSTWYSSHTRLTYGEASTPCPRMKIAASRLEWQK